MIRLSTIVFAGLALVAAGCGGEPPKPTKVPIPSPAKKEAKMPPAPAKDISAPAPPKAPAAAEERNVEPPPKTMLAYNYNPRGKPDPFKPLIAVEPPKAAPAAKIEAAMREGATPLEKVDLDQLKVVALVWGIPEPRALIETSKGDGFIITLGTPVGKRYGTVTQITSSGVVVTEKVESSLGKFKNQERTLKLYSE